MGIIHWTTQVSLSWERPMSGPGDAVSQKEMERPQERRTWRSVLLLRVKRHYGKDKDSVETQTSGPQLQRTKCHQCMNAGGDEFHPF